MKVAAYCRVSTDSEDQINSLENQIAFFNEYIQRNSNWTLVEIYSDEGITGTSVVKRTGFNSMIQDAKSGKIDLILTKEVSRFARNTVDTLNYTRELRKINVGVYFINDNINTMDLDGEFRLSIMASVAQEESRKISLRTSFGMRHQMRKGFVFSSPLIGYDLNNGVLTVNEEEAKIIRRIFDLYVNQKFGSSKIAQILSAENMPLCKRIKSWSATLIMRIIKNEKYVGDLIQQKTIVKDYLTHKPEKNTGEKFVFYNHHEPIVDRETWNMAQELCLSKVKNSISGDNSSKNNKYWCSGKIQCGTCKSSFVGKNKKAKYGHIRQYHCKHNSVDIGNKCENRSYIDERIIVACMQHIVRKLMLDSEKIMSELSDMLYRTDFDKTIEDKLHQLEDRAFKAEQKKKKYLSFLAEDIITKEEYKEVDEETNKELECLQRDIKKYSEKQIKKQSTENSINTILTHIKTYAEQSSPTIQLYN